MRDSKYNGMFKVGEEKLIFRNLKTSEETHKTPVNTHKYDLPNRSVYDLNGELFNEEGQRMYDTLFLLSFDRMNVLDVKPFLEHHYSYTPNKSMFLEYVEHGILQDENIIKGGVKSAMGAWIKEKRDEIEKQNRLHEKHKISHELTGLIGDYNQSKTIQPVFHYINDVLIKHNLDAKAAIQILRETKGAMSEEWYNNVTLKIINHLKEIQSDFNDGNSKLERETVNYREPKNPHPKIFKNGYAWEMFLELKRLSVDKSPLADYSFIYFKMIDKKLGAINETVTHPIFIRFLNENCETDINARKLTFKNQQSKQKLYSTTLAKFKADILSNP